MSAERAGQPGWRRDEPWGDKLSGVVVVRCKGSSDTGWGRESDRVAQHESHKNVNATKQWTEPVAKRGLGNRMTHQQRNNMLARATGERKLFWWRV